jgi:ribosomal protein L16 Arg81 hydroxylase
VTKTYELEIEKNAYEAECKRLKVMLDAHMTDKQLDNFFHKMYSDRGDLKEAVDKEGNSLNDKVLEI